MTPIQFKEANFTFVAPPGQEDKVLPLPCFRGNNQEHQPVIVTRWQLSEEEIASVVKNGTIDLIVMGERMHPLSLHAENVFSVIEEPEILPTKIIKLDGTN
jgi:hypothetical protein